MWKLTRPKPAVTVTNLVTRFQARAPKLYFAEDVETLCAAVLEREEADKVAWEQIERVLFLLAEYCSDAVLRQKLIEVSRHIRDHPDSAERTADCIAAKCGI